MESRGLRALIRILVDIRQNTTLQALGTFGILLSVISSSVYFFVDSRYESRLHSLELQYERKIESVREKGQQKLNNAQSRINSLEQSVKAVRSNLNTTYQAKIKKIQNEYTKEREQLTNLLDSAKRLSHESYIKRYSSAIKSHYYARAFYFINCLHEYGTEIDHEQLNSPRFRQTVQSKRSVLKLDDESDSTVICMPMNSSQWLPGDLTTRDINDIVEKINRNKIDPKPEIERPQHTDTFYDIRDNVLFVRMHFEEHEGIEFSLIWDDSLAPFKAHIFRGWEYRASLK